MRLGATQSATAPELSVNFRHGGYPGYLLHGGNNNELHTRSLPRQSDSGQMYNYLESRIDVLKQRISQLEVENAALKCEMVEQQVATPEISRSGQNRKAGKPATSKRSLQAQHSSV